MIHPVKTDHETQLGVRRERAKYTGRYGDIAIDAIRDQASDDRQARAERLRRYRRLVEAGRPLPMWGE